MEVSPHPRFYCLFVFAYEYSAASELDAFTTRGSQDLSVREITARRSAVLPVSELVQARRRIPVPMEQLPEHWATVAVATSALLPEIALPVHTGIESLRSIWT